MNSILWPGLIISFCATVFSDIWVSYWLSYPRALYSARHNPRRTKARRFIGETITLRPGAPLVQYDRLGKILDLYVKTITWIQPKKPNQQSPTTSLIIATS